MTPTSGPPPSNAPTRGHPVFAFVVSLGVSLGCCGVVGATGAFVVVKRAEVTARRGWNLAPVVVATKALSPGTILTAELVDIRSVPEQLVTASVVKPDSASYLLGLPVLLPVAEGDALQWAFFPELGEAARSKDTAVLEACRDALWGTR